MCGGRSGGELVVAQLGYKRLAYRLIDTSKLQSSITNVAVSSWMCLGAGSCSAEIMYNEHISDIRMNITNTFLNMALLKDILQMLHKG
jgi:hypothetical protein